MPILIVAAARRREPPAVNLVVDGNSISANFYTSIGTLDEHLMLVEPLASSDATHSCHAVSGASWADMLSHGAAVDADYDPERINVLYIMEDVNSLYDGRSFAQITADIQAYTSARRAAHPDWIIVHGQSVPFGGSAAWADENVIMAQLAAAIEADPGSYGIDATVSFRDRPEFDHDGSAPGPFQAYPAVWWETGPYWVHLTDYGKSLITPDIVAAIYDAI